MDGLSLTLMEKLKILNKVMNSKIIEISSCHKQAWGDRCCCTCRYRLEDRSHPSTDKGSVLQQRGWICAADSVVAFSGWSEHGLCEMHAFIPSGFTKAA